MTRPVAAEEVAELARAGAGRAALALGMLVKAELEASEPRPAAEGLRSSGDLTGIVFEMEGGLGGIVALLLPPRTRDALVASMCPGREDDEAVVTSALREAGNIVASQAVSGAADAIGGRVQISVPTLVSEAAGKLVERLLAGRPRAGALRVDLRGAKLAEGAALVFAPDGSPGL